MSPALKVPKRSANGGRRQVAQVIRRSRAAVAWPRPSRGVVPVQLHQRCVLRLDVVGLLSRTRTADRHVHLDFIVSAPISRVANRSLRNWVKSLGEVRVDIDLRAICTLAPARRDRAAARASRRCCGRCGQPLKDSDRVPPSAGVHRPFSRYSPERATLVVRTPGLLPSP